MIAIREYDGASGPFRRWLLSLDLASARRVGAMIEQLQNGNTSNVQRVGGGVSECRCYRRPGYRIYFGIDGTKRIVLLSGGTKDRQQRDIEAARALWDEYKRRPAAFATRQQRDSVGMSA